MFVLLILILLRGITIWGSELAAHQLAVKIKQELRNQLFEHIIHLGPGFLKQGKVAGGARSG